jgi:hypothetical protein
MAIGRFQVMAVLQAARAYVLGMPLVSAKSWGLNRAIFYAAAKKGFFKGTHKMYKEMLIKRAPLPREKIKKIQETFNVEYLGDEMAYSVEIDGKKYFTIGGEIQDENKFYSQVERRFEDKFDIAWNEAVEICKKVDKGVLLSQRYFFESVYKIRRDTLAEKWSNLLK